MMIFLNLYCVILAMYVLWKVHNRKISIAYIALLVFDVAYVLPLFVECIWGNAYIGYYGFELAMNDSLTLFVYAICVSIVQYLFGAYIAKNAPLSKDNKSIRAKSAFVVQISKARTILYYKHIVKFVLIILCTVPLVMIVLSPNPLFYFRNLGFYENAMELTSEELRFHTGSAKVFCYLGFLGVLGIKLCDVKILKRYSILRGVGIVGVTLLNGKRTLFAFLMLSMLGIDYLSNISKKAKCFRTIFTGGITIGYFFIYAHVTGKINYSFNIYSMISEYFFRSNSVKVAIFALLRPDKLNVLEYPLQTIIYNILFFIPRSVWELKPYPYPAYYTAAVYGISEIDIIGWRFQTGIYAEIISNCGFVGFFVAPLIILWLCKTSEYNKNLIVNMLGLFLIIVLQVFEFSDMFKVVFIVWSMLIIRGKIFKRRIRVICK